MLLIAPAPVAAAAGAALDALRRGETGPAVAPDGLTALHTAMRADLGVATDA